MLINDVIFTTDYNNTKRKTVSAFDDWNIVLTNADIPLPEPKTSQVEIKGMDGVLDLSEALTGDIQYSNRLIKLTFAIMDDTEYQSLITKISNFLHGRKVEMRFTNDNDYNYYGRAKINEWECNKHIGKIVITVDCEPYKIKRKVTSSDEITLDNESKTFNLTNGRQPAVFTVFLISGNVTMQYHNKDYVLSPANNDFSGNVVLEYGKNEVKFTGTGTFSFGYREGDL